MTVEMSPYQSFIATDYKQAVYKGKDLTGTVKGGYLIQGWAGNTKSSKGPRQNWAVVCQGCHTLFIISKYNWDLSEERFLELCRAVSNHQGVICGS